MGSPFLLLELLMELLMNLLWNLLRVASLTSEKGEPKLALQRR
jgi:hypothetical protein